jgi:hypothetical protein
MTFRGKRSGRQFVVVAAGGGNKYDKRFSGEIVAFAIDGAYEGAPASNAAKVETYQGKPETLPQRVAPQPIAFSHRIHMERAKVKCVDCHTGAVSGDRAGIASIKVCRACHASMSRSSGEPKWVRVYRVPDFVFFSHKEHAKPGIGCESCHGPVGTRDVLMKEVSTNMNSCMSCHRERKAPAGCALCHQLGH